MDASFFDETSILESVSPHQLGLELPNTMIPTIAQQQAVSLGTSVEAGLKLAREDLANFAREENAIAQLQSPFGSGLAMDIARDLLQNFADNDFSDLPGVVLKNSAEINHADGAYDALTGEIYLASEFVGENQSEAIASVLLEEIGHFIDSKINIEDAPGDEGEMFAALVQGESLSRSQLEAFQGENDGFENGAMAIEQSKRPDLHIGRKIAQNTAQAGESIQIWSYVKNRGKATAGTSYLKYYLSDDKYLSNNDAYLGKDYVTSLSPKNHSIENEWVKIPEATIAGKKYLLFQADGFNQVFESNEYNNVGYKRINIKASTGKADLIVSSSYVTSSVEAGNSAFVVSQVQNIGSGIAGMSNVNYYLSDDISLSSDDIYLGDDEINTLASGKSGYGFQRITIPDDVSVGQKYILFQADANNLIAESNEYNNIAYKSIQIAAPPDYAGNSLSEARDIGILKSQHTYSYDDWVGNSDANDYYKFTLTDHAALTIKLTDLSADANLQLLNSNGSVIKRSVNGGIQNDSISLVNSGIPAGTYYIRVYPNGSSNNTDYNLSVMAGAIGDGNDSLATAQSVNLSAFDNGDFALTLKGAKIGYSGNNWVLKDTQDYYKFSLFDTREVNLSLAGLQAHADLELLNSSGQVLNISSNNGTASESIRHILSAGTYYARVTSADNIETSYDLSLGQKIPKTYWQAEYFNNPDVSGSPVWIENLGYGHNGFDKDWGHGGPIASLKNNFSARMTTQRYLAPGLYHITTTADDGVRIKIGNEMVVDRWDLQASVTNSGFYYSRGYIVPIEVEYFESGEGASVDFDIKPAQLFTESVDLSSQWKGKIYHWDPTRSEKPLDDFHHGYLEENPNAIAAINLGSNTRSDGKKGINFDWGQGSIEGDGVRLPHDNFAIRAYTQAHFDGSEYTFRVRGDDGFQLLAKRHGGLDEWHYITSQDVWQEAYGDHTEFTYTLPAGVYDLTFHMYDSVRNAYFDLSWEKEQTWTAKYFNNTKLFGEPVFEENLGKNIAFSKNWGSGGPDSLRDNFSAQMTTERYLEPGLYQITTNADDGIRVKIGNQTIINRWQEQDSMTNSGFYRSSGETVSIVVEYFESGGDASLNFDLKPAEKFREFVDVSTQWNATVFHWDPTKGSQPSTNFYDGGINHNPNAIATINLGSNTRSNGKKGISFDWERGAPKGYGDRLPHEYFAVRAYTQAHFDGGEYKFRVRGNDGFQLLAKKHGTNEWFYITPEDNWNESYDRHDEITYTLPSGMYDLHFHQYEVTGLNNFDLSWEKVSSLSGYYSELHSLNSDQWDEYTWDNTRFDSPMWDGEIDERWKNPESVKQIYTDLSKAVFGTRFAMTAGYLNDTSYYVWSDKWHAGIDMKSPAGTTVKNVVGGTVSWVHNNGDAKGWFIGVNSNDGNQWVYGHLNKPIVSVGSYVNIGQSLGTISGGSKANHFHLEVQPGHRYNDTNGAHPDKNFVRNVTMSPLQAFWNWKNS